MAILRGLAVTAVGLVAGLVVGCYDPQLQDCVVRCASDGDCAPDQVCNSLQLCAAPNGGACGGTVDVDGALRDGSIDPLPTDAAEPPPLRDGALVDAAPPPPPPPDAAPPPPPPPDAPPAVRYPLLVSLRGMGSVEVLGVGTCVDECTFDVLPGTYTLRGEAAPMWRLDKWQEDCAPSGSASTCTLVVSAAAHGRLKLKRD